MSTPDLQRTVILTAEEIASQVDQIAREILERYSDKALAFVGIYSRGVSFANRVQKIVASQGTSVVAGTLDINLYRDDLDNRGTSPALRSSDILFPVEDAHIILFDDVLFTGRTTRAAIGALTDFGRPARIELAVLIDRGNRELPIQADYVGHRLDTTKEDHIQVRFEENDGEEGIFLLQGKENG